MGTSGVGRGREAAVSGGWGGEGPVLSVGRRRRRLAFDRSAPVEQRHQDDHLGDDILPAEQLGGGRSSPWNGIAERRRAPTILYGPLRRQVIVSGVGELIVAKAAVHANFVLLIERLLQDLVIAPADMERRAAGSGTASGWEA